MPPVAPPDTFSLLADIGGTNTRVALARGTALLPDTVRRYRNAEFSGLEAVLGAYLEEEGNPDCAGACIAVAGLVHDGVASLTNLGWTIDTETLARAARAERALVINDLQA
ncbi:MAG: glucokinase, partial [Alphaproteobacteria bacterium]